MVDNRSSSVLNIDVELIVIEIFDNGYGILFKMMLGSSCCY